MGESVGVLVTLARPGKQWPGNHGGFGPPRCGCGRGRGPSARQRALQAQHIDGRVAVIDVPVDHDDRVYLVERDIERNAALDGVAAAMPTSSRPSWLKTRREPSSATRMAAAHIESGASVPPFGLEGLTARTRFQTERCKGEGRYMTAAEEHPVVKFVRMYSTHYRSGRDVHEIADRLAEMPQDTLDKAAHAAMIMISDVHNSQLRATSRDKCEAPRRE